jgi:hypothetical protein
MRRGLLDRLEKLDGSKRSRAVVLATVPDENGEPVDPRSFDVMTFDEWELRFCKPETASEAKDANDPDRGHK